MYGEQRGTEDEGDSIQPPGNASNVGGGNKAADNAEYGTRDESSRGKLKRVWVRVKRRFVFGLRE